MATKNKKTAIVLFAAAALMSGAPAYAETVAMNTAKMQALDKITGKIKEIDIPVNGEVRFGSFSVVVRSCQSTPPGEKPENYAFVDVADTQKDGTSGNIFKGWMISSSPSLNSVEHPIYDVWLLKCHNTNVIAETLLPESVLAERDALKKYMPEDLSKEAIKAIQVQEEQSRKEEAQRQAQAEEEALKKEQQEIKELLDKEIAEHTPAAEPVVDDAGEDGEGPVSLLKIMQQAPSEKAPAETTDAPGSEDEVILDDDAAVSETIEVYAVEPQNLHETVVIEDTHHETAEDLALPEDIDEIMPKQE